MPELFIIIIAVAIITVGFLALLAGLIYVGWWLIGQIIKMSGYWDMFYRSMVIASKEIRREKNERIRKRNEQ